MFIQITMGERDMERVKKHLIALVFVLSSSFVLARDMNGKLFDAVRPGSPFTIANVLESGSIIDERNNEGLTPLMLAAELNNVEAVQELIARGASLDLLDNNGNTALILAAGSRFTKEVAEELIAAKADLNIKNNRGDTALLRATFWGNPAVVKRLIEEGAELNVQDKYQNTPLMLTVQWLNDSYPEELPSDVELVENMLNAGADPCIKDDMGRTPKDVAKSEEVKNILDAAMENCPSFR